MKTQCVYFVLGMTSGLIKIGRTGDITRRLEQLRTGSPEELKLIGTITTDRASRIEKSLHVKWGSRCVRLEWHRMTVQEAIDEITNRTAIERSYEAAMAQKADCAVERQQILRFGDSVETNQIIIVQADRRAG